MTDSPYVTPTIVPGQATAAESLTHDTLNGRTRVVHAETTELVVNPVTLDQTQTTRKVFVVSVSGRAIAPGAPTYACRGCHREPFLEPEVLGCGCGRIVCRDKCTRNTTKGPECRRCAWRTRLKEFFSWLCQW